MNATLPSDTLNTAVEKARTAWLRAFLIQKLPPLQAGSLTAQDFADMLRAEFEERKLHQPSQQKNYRSNVSQALKAIDPDHPAIRLVLLPKTDYDRINNELRRKVGERKPTYVTPAAAEALVQRAEELLSSCEWADVAAAIAVLMGRRISEILVGTYAPKSEWSLLFSGLAKKPDGVDPVIEIPTLAPAPKVLKAIEKLQRALGANDIKREAHGDIKVARYLAGKRYGGTVAKRCESLFSDFVAPRKGRDRLYTHLFRAVYTAIAAYWFCPPTAPIYEFKAQIQGHFVIDEEGESIRSKGSRASYDDYVIGSDETGPAGGCGIKLGTLPGLEVLEVFR